MDIKNWKEFVIQDLFDIETGKDFIYSEAEGNKHHVIGHGIENNGVACKSETLNNYKLFDNEKTISMAHIGNYHSFVQITPFYLGTRTKALTAKFKTNKYIFLFITTIINSNSYKFSYGRVGSDKIPTEKISLPIEYELNNDGTFKLDTDNNKIPKIDETKTYSKEGYIPDFKFMENYIKLLPYGDKI